LKGLGNMALTSPGGRASESALAADYDGHNLVLVAGCQRSGTTWLQRLLATHPKVRTGQESYLFSVHIGPQLLAWKELSEVPNSHRISGLGCYFSKEEFRSILKSYLLRLLEPMVGNLAPGEIFLEKTPDNALRLPEALELLPRVRVIHIIRDARDVVSSLTSREAWLEWAPADARSAASLWVRHIEAVRNAMPVIPAGQFFEVRYEDLLQNPAKVLRETADFLGLEWSASEIEKAVELNHAHTARKTGGTPIPVFGDAAKRFGSVVVEPEGFIRRAKSGSWKNDLSFSQKFWVWRAAHKTMEENGYDWPKSSTLVFAFACAIVNSGRLVVKKFILGEFKR
jgi:hypothetical protein